VRSIRVRVRASALCCAALAVASQGCSRKLERAECTKLLDRYTELLVKDEEPDALPERIAQAQARARATAQKDARFDFSSCSSRVSRREYECAMSAPTVDAVERCLVF
jgi:hypothetical protein